MMDEITVIKPRVSPEKKSIYNKTYNEKNREILATKARIKYNANKDEINRKRRERRLAKKNMVSDQATL